MNNGHSDWYNSIQQMSEFLDTIDILPLITEFKGELVWSLMYYLMEHYDYKDEYSTELFDCMSQYDFVLYLNNRYEINIREKEYEPQYYL